MVEIIVYSAGWHQAFKQLNLEWLDKFNLREDADMIVLNSLQDAGAGFGHDTNKITIFDKTGKAYPFDIKSKKEVAKDIVNTIIQQFYAKN